MPVLFRTMQADADGLPRVGATFRTLGARPGRDLPVEPSGHVRPDTGGMSVTANDPKALPKPVRPRSLGGESRDTLFSVQSGDLPADVALRDDPPGGAHLLVEPVARMFFEAYQGAIHGTRPKWSKA